MVQLNARTVLLSQWCCVTKLKVSSTRAAASSNFDGVSTATGLVPFPISNGLMGYAKKIGQLDARSVLFSQWCCVGKN